MQCTDTEFGIQPMGCQTGNVEKKRREKQKREEAPVGHPDETTQLYSYSQYCFHNLILSTDQKIICQWSEMDDPIHSAHGSSQTLWYWHQISYNIWSHPMASYPLLFFNIYIYIYINIHTYDKYDNQCKKKYNGLICSSIYGSFEVVCIWCVWLDLNDVFWLV